MATTCLMVLALVGEQAVYAKGGLAEAVPSLTAVGAGMAVTMLAALAVRVLKKSGRLRENPA